MIVNPVLLRFETVLRKPYKTAKPYGILQYGYAPICIGRKPCCEYAVAFLVSVLWKAWCKTIRARFEVPRRVHGRRNCSWSGGSEA